jgi:hypothetical protein
MVAVPIPFVIEVPKAVTRQCEGRCNVVRVRAAEDVEEGKSVTTWRVKVSIDKENTFESD